MKANIKDELALRAVSPHSLRAYAESEGWQATAAYGAHSKIYINNLIRDTEAVIPATSSLADYSSVVSDLIGIFARAENRDELQVYRDLVTADRDLIRFRTVGAEDSGAIKIEDGVEIVTSARDLLLSAACSAWDPRPIYRAGKVRQADEYMDKVRLGQTEQGSFIVTLLAPVPPSIPQSQLFGTDDTSEPYERRVTKIFCSGLDHAADAVEKINLGGSFSDFENAVPFGVSANLCSATATLAAGYHGIDISISWARTRPSNQKRWQRSFTRDEGVLLKEVARAFSERAPRKDLRIEGLVIDLHSVNPADGGTIKLRTLVEEKPTSLQIELDSAQYASALEAHESKSAVSVMGDLSKIGHRWRLINPSNLDILRDESENQQLG
jgi:hypothetical protein